MDSSMLLLVFDFDHSLVDENTDYYIIKLAPGGELPEEITSLYSDDGWTAYMGEIFKFLHKNGQSPDSMQKCLSEIPLTEGMKDLLDFTTSTKQVDHIVISDANSVFIEHILEQNDLSSTFKEIFTNPAEFQENGCLTVKEHHFQDWCKLSTKNLCKGHILDGFLSKQSQLGVNYKHIIYVGDGFNDLCPGLRLRPQDCLMPRNGFKLHKVVENMASKQEPVPRDKLIADVVSWNTGFDILRYIKDLGLFKSDISD